MLASLSAVLKSILLFATLIALVGGLTADIPGVKDDPAGGATLRFAATAWLSLLYVAWNYPLGSGLGIATITVFHWLLIHPGYNRLRKEVNATRHKGRSRNRGRSATVKDGRKKGRRRR